MQSFWNFNGRGSTHAYNDVVRLSRSVTRWCDQKSSQQYSWHLLNANTLFMIVQSQTLNKWSQEPSGPPTHPAHPIQPLCFHLLYICKKEYGILDVSWKALHFVLHLRLDGMRCLSLSLCRIRGGLIYSLGFISTRLAVLICSLILCTVTGCDRLFELELSAWDSMLSAILKCDQKKKLQTSWFGHVARLPEWLGLAKFRVWDLKVMAFGRG